LNSFFCVGRLALEDIVLTPQKVVAILASRGKKKHFVFLAGDFHLGAANCLGLAGELHLGTDSCLDSVGEFLLGNNSDSIRQVNDIKELPAASNQQAGVSIQQPIFPNNSLTSTDDTIWNFQRRPEPSASS